MRATMMAAMAAVSQAALVEVHRPSVVPQGWAATGDRLSGAAVFHNVGVTLKRSNVAALKKHVAEVSDPQHANYLQYMTYEEVGNMVRPSAAATATVKAWLAQEGVFEVAEHPHGDAMTFSATAAQLEALAHGKFTTYKHAASGVVTHRVTSGVHVPEEVAAVIDTFSGFTGFPLDPTPAVRAEKANLKAAGKVTPPVVRATYNVSSVPKSGKTNIQAIGQFQGQYVSDSALEKFCEKYDTLSGSCKIDKYIGKDVPILPGTESMLDVEYIVPLSNLATTWVYSYPNTDFCNDLITFGNAATTENPHPYVVSLSYGSQKIDFCETSLIQRFADDVEKMGALGITVMISSGDDGSGHSTRQGTNEGKLSPAYPASVPHAVAVGSTFWVRGTSGEEQASTQFGSGGGFSYDYTAPSYQTQAVSTYLSTVDLPKTLAYAKNGRGTPDVSLLGESFTVFIHGIALPVGGTSASSPSFAGLVTLLNEVCLSVGGKSLGFANPLFYQNAGAFRDVTKGTNKINQPEGWAAVKGWDACTGLGTPDFPKLVTAVRAACSSSKKH